MSTTSDPLQRPGPRPAPDSLEAVARGHRRWLGVGVVALVSLIQVLSQYLTSHDRGRLLVHLLFFAVGMPTLMVSLSLGFSIATRRRLGSIPTLFAGLLLAALLGAGLWAGLWLLAQHAPTFRPHYEGGWKLPRAVIFGSLN